MNRLILCLILILNFDSLKSQNRNELTVSKTEIKQIFLAIKDSLRGKNFYICEIPSAEENPPTKKEFRDLLKYFNYDSFYVASDYNFLVSQIRFAKSIIWDSSFIDSAKFLKRSFLDSAFKNQQRGMQIDSMGNSFYKLPDPPHFTFSIPLFNKRKDMCRVSAWYWCGHLCGQGYEFTLKLIEKHWIVYKISYGPVS